jgi:hypothetical protein
MMTVFVQPRAFLVLGLVLTTPAIAEITGTNLLARPAEITGTNLLARPAEITGTNRSAVVGSAVARSASFSAHGSARAVVRDARCESEVSMLDAACEQF